ncbi:hypothetical protein K9K77_02260 [Candidatus Babeliales bacterium]|nr:hypothetical protein [Candidatus Babeliales bacterium]
MNRIITLFIWLFVCVPVMSKAQHMPVNFTTNLYTESPIKKVNSLVMKLWSHVNAADLHEEQYIKFLTVHEQFVKEVLLLSSLLDNALIVIEHQAYDCPECVDYAVHDLVYVLRVLESLNEHYFSLMNNQEGDLPIVTFYLLKSIIQKVKEVTETGHVVTPLYAFINSQNSSLSSFKIS